MFNFIWLDIDSSLQTSDSKLPVSDSTQPSHDSTLTRKILRWLWLDSWFDKYDSATSQATGRDGFREGWALGHLSFGGPKQVWPIWPFVWKAWKYTPLMCAPQTSIVCCADFGSTLALGVQQKLKPFLHTTKEQMALLSFLGIYNSFV